MLRDERAPAVAAPPSTAGTRTDDIAPQKTELLVRIAIQNLTLLMAVAVFAGLGMAGVAWAKSAWVVACVHAVVSGALLQWCHNGVRTMQLKAFLLEREGRQPSDWEVWLPSHRPERLLETRWFISTKGVFLGLQVAMAGLAVATVGIRPLWASAACAIALLFSAGLLLTNPKE